MLILKIRTEIIRKTSANIRTFTTSACSKFKFEISNNVAKINEKITILSKSTDELDASSKNPVT